LVSVGHAVGSTAIALTSFPFNLSAIKGKEMPEKLEPPPQHPITISGYIPIEASCFLILIR